MGLLSVVNKYVLLSLFLILTNNALTNNALTNNSASPNSQVPQNTMPNATGITLTSPGYTSLQVEGGHLVGIN